MYLSRLILNPRSKQVQAELANPYQMHRTIMQGFPQTLPPGERILHRLDLDGQYNAPELLVQSLHQPNWNHLLGESKDYLLSLNAASVLNPAVKPFNPQFIAGQSYLFRLRANPSKKVAQVGKSQGRRVGLYKEDEQRKWLERKLQQCGCSLVDVRITKQDNQGGFLKRDQDVHKLNLAAVRFDGILIVEQPDLLKMTVEKGIGSGKGLGFGLLSLSRT